MFSPGQKGINIAMCRMRLLTKALSTEALAGLNKVTGIQEETKQLKSPVCSYNEWDPLEVSY